MNQPKNNIDKKYSLKKYKIKQIIDKTIIVKSISYNIGTHKEPYARFEFKFFHQYRKYIDGYFNMPISMIKNGDKDLKAIKLPARTSIIEIDNNFYAINL